MSTEKKTNTNGKSEKKEKDGKIPMWVKVLLFVGAFALAYALRDINLIQEGGNLMRRVLMAPFQTEAPADVVPSEEATEEIIETPTPAATDFS